MTIEETEQMSKKESSSKVWARCKETKEKMKEKMKEKRETVSAKFETLREAREDLLERVRNIYKTDEKGDFFDSLSRVNFSELLKKGMENPILTDSVELAAEKSQRTFQRFKHRSQFHYQRLSESLKEIVIKRELYMDSGDLLEKVKLSYDFRRKQLAGGVFAVADTVLISLFARKVMKYSAFTTLAIGAITFGAVGFGTSFLAKRDLEKFKEKMKVKYASYQRESLTAEEAASKYADLIIKASAEVGCCKNENSC
jgi:hypothetical protein